MQDRSHKIAKVQQFFRQIREGELDLAEFTARNIRKNWPTDPQSDFILGYALAARNKTTEALEYLSAAVRAQPDNLEFKVRFGIALLEVGQLLRAETILKAALQINPNHIVVLWSLGQFYVSISRSDLAQEYFKKALHLNPPEKFRRMIKLQWIRGRAECGDIEGAQNELRTDISGNGPTVNELALLLELNIKNTSAGERTWLEEALSMENLSVDSKSLLLNLKGNILDNLREYDDAFKALVASKSLLKSNFQMPSFILKTDQIMRVFNSDSIKKIQYVRGRGSGFAPIYIIGMPRSGTTLTEQILSKHRAVSSAGELREIGRIEAAIRGDCGYENDKKFLKRFLETNYDESAADAEGLMRYLGGNQVRIIDKMPHNFMSVHVIKFLFPDAKIVHCFRNPADNFLSAFLARMNEAHSYTYNVKSYSDYYAVYARMIGHWKQFFSDSIYSFEYERLISEPRTTIEKLLHFLELDWDESCLTPEQNNKRVATPSFIQVRNPINNKSVGGWKNYEKYLKPLHERFGRDLPDILHQTQ